MTAADDVLARRLVAARLLALGRLAPGRDRMTATRGTAFTTTMGMVNRVHHNAANMRTLAEPAITARLRDGDVRVVGVRHGANRRHAGTRHHALLARRKAEKRITTVAAHDLHIGTSGTGDLTALARLHLHIVHDRADGDVLKRHRIARLHVNAVTRDHPIASRDTLRREDVCKLTVVILDERDERRTVRVILQPLDS